MANTPSAKKALKQSEARNALNRARKTLVKTHIKKVHTALSQGKTHEEVQVLVAEAASVLGRARGKGVLHQNTASRKLSRLAKLVNTHFKKS